MVDKQEWWITGILGFRFILLMVGGQGGGEVVASKSCCGRKPTASEVCFPGDNTAM